MNSRAPSPAADPAPANPGKEAGAGKLWQPIETAPRDETPVLVAYRDAWMTVAAFWPCNMCWTEITASGRKLNEPTHWMPLPEPPA